jgi:hypothetical protein
MASALNTDLSTLFDITGIVNLELDVNVKSICGIKRTGGQKQSVSCVVTVDALILILVNDQLDALFFFRICLFQFSTCFEHPCAHHQENQLY